MIDTGKYQSEITTLVPLGIKNYERIFKIFKESLDNREFYVYNILKKIEFPEIDGQYIEYYSTVSKLPLTILSYKIYGDINSWWILYLLNKDKFIGAPFYVEGSTQIKYITNTLRTSIYTDITNATVYGGRHY
jgi:hypothetical protein